jgi:hypothetical protein
LSEKSPIPVLFSVGILMQSVALILIPTSSSHPFHQSRLADSFRPRIVETACTGLLHMQGP